MKINFFVFLFILSSFLFTTSSFAQTEKGTLSIGLQLDGLNSAKVDLLGEYFIKDNWSIGGGIGDFVSINSTNSNTFQLSTFATTRKYFRSNKKMQPFIGARLGFIYHDIDNGDSFKMLSLVFGVETGLQYNINKNWSLMTNLQIKNESNSYLNITPLTIDFLLGVGVKYNFGSK